MKKMTLKSWSGELKDVWFRVNEYANNGNMALALWSDDGPFDMLTVNLKKLPKNHAAVDINNLPEGIDLIQRYKLGKRADDEILSGFCIYPVYEFNMDEVMKYVEVK